MPLIKKIVFFYLISGLFLYSANLTNCYSQNSPDISKKIDTLYYGSTMEISWDAPIEDIMGNKIDPRKFIKYYGFWFKHQDKDWSEQKSFFLYSDSSLSDTLQIFHKEISDSFFDLSGKYILVMTAFNYLDMESDQSNAVEFFVDIDQKNKSYKSKSPYIIYIKIKK